MANAIRPASLVVSALLIAAALAIHGQRTPKPVEWPAAADAKGQATLPSAWRVTPAGRHIALPGDMPLGMTLTPDGRYLVLNTGGFHDHSVCSLDTAAEKLTAAVDVRKTWAPLAFDTRDGSVYVTGGSYSDAKYAEGLTKRGVAKEAADALSKPIYRLTFRDGQLAIAEGIDVPGMGKGRFAGGIVVLPDGALVVVDINADTLYRLAPATRAVTAQARLGYRPCALALSRDGKTLAAANWGDGSVSLLEAATLNETARVAVGSHPNALLYGRDSRLFVACGGENRVAVLRGEEVVASINTSLEPNAPIGTTPDALALSPDGRTLFVACAGSNAVLVADVSRGDASVRGFIPTGWYPSALAVSADGKRLFVGTGKGLAFRRNFPGQVREQETTDDGRTKYDYIGNVLSGAVSVVDIPNGARLAAYTRQVRANVPTPATDVVPRAQIADARRAFSRIKHVLYIIRENRTYDQVFGDLTGTNADPSITMYGENVTPNAHALARKTVALDNLYCSGEVSEDGHRWCNAAYATDFTERAWINSYSDRGEPDEDGRLSDSPAGSLWDNCARHGLSYRSYGEFVSFRSDPKTAPVFSGPQGLKGHASEAWSIAHTTPDARDTNAADAFVQELRDAERTGNWPRYMVMSLGEDHTHGLSPGQHTPFACVASNDLALGRIVEAVSRSRFWPETAIFVIEDDAQDGPDHVDAHRTVGLVISPYVRRGVVDSTLYTTNSMLRTMELILGLPPMTQFDQHAAPMYNSFTSKADLAPYDAVAARVDLAARNPQSGPGAAQSARLDFRGYDRADPAILNRLLWANARPGKSMPAPVHSGILTR